MTPLTLLTGIVLLSAIALVRSQKSASRLSNTSWEDLLRRLVPVEGEGITAVAREYLNPTKGQIATEPPELWELIGGAAGLARMTANAEVLIALASYAQRWNDVESRIVAERMRRDGLALRRSARVLNIAVYLGVGRARAAFHIHEAASAYYLMRQRLLALYETSHVARLPQLAAAV
jgi:hypothetical protein